MAAATPPYTALVATLRTGQPPAELAAAGNVALRTFGVGGKQEDAHELLVFLVDSLQAVLPAVGHPQTLVARLFRCLYVETIECFNGHTFASL